MHQAQMLQALLLRVRRAETLHCCRLLTPPTFTSLTEIERSQPVPHILVHRAPEGALILFGG